MFFAGLFAMYFVGTSSGERKFAAGANRIEPVFVVPVTLVLIASSFTCQMGVFAAERGTRHFQSL